MACQKANTVIILKVTVEVRWQKELKKGREKENKPERHQEEEEVKNIFISSFIFLLTFILHKDAMANSA